jgi:hypothetical protein
MSPCHSQCRKYYYRDCNNYPEYNAGYMCLNFNSAVDGQWGPWNVAKVCSVSCGNGTEEYSRSCDNPAPAHGGKQCSGPSLKQSPCSASPCGTYLFKLSITNKIIEQKM